MTGPAVATVVVVGSGITAWSTAAAVKRRIPLLDVTIIPAPVDPAALADRMIGTLPSIHGFHHDIGLTDEDAIARSRSGLRAGTLFEDWVEGLPDYIHAYGPYGAPIGGVSFHQLWVREGRHAELPPFDRFSRAADLARAGNSQLIDIGEAGLQLSLDLYSTMIRAFARHVGVRERNAAVRGVRLNSADGFINDLQLEDATSFSADLYIDCSGPSALLRSEMAGSFLDWCDWLPCDRLAFGRGSPIAQAIALDRVTAVDAGWRWTASSPDASSSGIAYSSAHAPAIDLEATIIGAREEIKLRQGRWDEPWKGNCVAIGDSAVSVEPLEWTNLHLVHSQIDRLIAMIPGKDCAPVELAEFNRQCTAEADRIRDFLCLHYVSSRRPEPFWREASEIAPPASLAHTLSQFAERGRLPYYEEETFARDSWLAVLLGQGFEPRSTDPLAELVGPAQALQAIRAMRQSLERSAPFIPASNPIDLNPRGAR